MMPIKVPPDLPELVKAAFSKAREGGDLTYFPTQVAILKAKSIPFQLRFSAALANKPKPNPPSTDSNTKKTPYNPFENPAPALVVSQLPPAHYLVLNKFAVVPEHFILATTAFAPQTDLLDASDLAAAYACVAAYHSAGRPLFAFFNCGAHSGASQRHRHLQLLPVDRMTDGLEAVEDGHEWDVLVDGLVRGSRDVRDLPFAAGVAALQEGMDGADLRDVYLQLYREACRAAGVQGEIADEGEAVISYNMAMTKDVMAIMPRKAEGAPLEGQDGQDGQDVGMLALNGTVLAGTALVKNEAEWDVLRKRPELLLQVLGRIGFSPS